MESETPTLRAAPSGGSALPGPGAEHRGALLRYATRLLEKAAEHAGEVVDATLAQAAMESAVAGTPAAEAGGPDGGTGAAADDRAVEKLFAAVRRQALTRMRREGVAQRTAAADGDEAASSLTERVERLTPKQREVVWLKFSHGFGYEAVSGITGLSVHNVGFLLHSALTNLREAASAEGRVVAADDARVTDYVLEEMTADQRAAFDRALRRDDAATTALREVRALVMELHATFGNNEETSQRAKQKRRGAGAAWWRAKRVWGVAAGAVALGLGVWWYSQPERTPTKKATATEVFQMKPDVWKLAKARAEREEREARAKAGDGANARPGATDRTKDQPADERPTAETEKADRGETPAEPAKDGAEAARPEPAAGSPPVKENSPGKAEKPRADNRKAKPADDDGVDVRLPASADASGAGAAGGSDGAGAAGENGPGTAGSSDAPGGVPNAGTMGAAGAPTSADGGSRLGNFSEPGRGGAKAAGLPGAPGAGRGAPVSAKAGGTGAMAPPKSPAATAAVAVTTGRDAKEARTAAPDDAGQPEADMAAMGKLRATLAGKRWPAARAAEIRALLSQFENERAVPVKAPGVSVAVEVAEAPWDPERRLVRVVVTAAPATSARAASANVVLLIDVSRSMDAPNRLPLVQAAARRLLRDLQPDDRVSVVTYAGEARVALPPTPMTRAAEVRTVLGALRAEGQTNGGAGLRRAYVVARAGFVAGGVNRVVLCTDGDFNMGLTGEAELAALVEAEAKGGVGLAVFGFGRGRQIDPRLEALAAKGRGGSGNVNTPHEAERRLAAEANGWGAAVARGLRLDFDCDPARIAVCRLVGYDENFLPPEIAGRSRTEVGDLAPGESVTALFEVMPTEAAAAKPGETGAGALPWLTVRASFTATADGSAQTRRVPVTDAGARLADASAEFKFSAAVAGLGLALRESPPSPARLAAVVGWAEAAVAEQGGRDPGGYREEFLALAREARELAGK